MKKFFDSSQTWLQCIGCGLKADLLDERHFECKSCGDLFDIRHNLSHLKGDFSKLARTFDQRAKDAISFEHADNPIYRSGVWRFKELIMPHLPNDQIVTLGEGNVPIVRAGQNLKEWTGCTDLWMILEGMTPTGSFKDFGMTVMMSIAKAAGIKIAVCASTGDTSAAAAAFTSAAGMQCYVLLPKGKVTDAQIAQPLAHGAKVILLPGTFDDCMRVVQNLTNSGRVFPANSLNPTRIEGHQATVFLTAQFFSWQLPKWFALPVGNGSNCSSIGKGVRLLKDLGYNERMPRILGCQSEAAAPLSTSWSRSHWDVQEVTVDRWKDFYKKVEVGETTATAARIGDPVSRDKVIREVVASDGRMCIAKESDLNEAVRVCGRDGHFVCPQTGTALAGVRDAVKRQEIRRSDRVVVVSTATGLKFTESAVAGLKSTIVEAKDCEIETAAEIMGL